MLSLLSARLHTHTVIHWSRLDVGTSVWSSTVHEDSPWLHTLGSCVSQGLVLGLLPFATCVLLVERVNESLVCSTSHLKMTHSCSSLWQQTTWLMTWYCKWQAHSAAAVSNNLLVNADNSNNHSWRCWSAPNQQPLSQSTTSTWLVWC